MESIQQTVTELGEHFTQRMAEFQRSLQSSVPATSPTSNINAQFAAFRSFILSALEALQSQVQLLFKMQDDMEMRSRRKILLIHGVPESKGEKLDVTVTKILSQHLTMVGINESCVNRCHRLGSPRSDKPRAILIKFNDQSFRNKVWFGKTGFKNTGITVSEFLTKERHNVFMAARKRLGITKCWTKDGRIVVVGSDGTRNYIISMAELNILATESQAPAQGLKAAASTSSANPDPKLVRVNRLRKVTKR
ncbi:uncharacterized protein LOC120634716 [Pararge aegeria]|uniref:uncharacterized protein LOC120634716 n=1 Tax=Pararge aegeria TaxID=116150 RepID=UPI0019D12BB7|nr:uncharacterized protein LOC120634716 [Pararge aegeria]